MTRCGYGPWDDRYYPVLDALTGRGLLGCARGRRGNVAPRLTPKGRRRARMLTVGTAWRDVATWCEAVAEHIGAWTGNRLEDLVRLLGIVDQPQREVIRP